VTQARRAPQAARPAAALSSRRRASIGSAAEDFDAEAFAQLYSKLAVTMSASQTVASANDSLLSVMIPGQYLEQNLDPSAASTQYLLSNVLNPTLECSWITRRNAATVPDVYEAIINGKETPLVQLSPEQKAELDRAVRLLYQADGVPTPYYADYLADSLDYLTALDAFEQAEATQANGGPPVPPEIRAALEAADVRWRDHGHQADVDRALATIADLEAFEPAKYWHQLAQRYRDSTRSFDDSRYQHTICNPPYPRWFDDEGWTAFSFDEHDFINQDRSGGVGVGDGCRCPDGVRPATYGGFHSAAADFVSDGRRLSGSAPSRFSLTARLRRVEIMRPWLDPVVLRSRAWRWSPASGTYGVVVCSGGNLAGAVVPAGLMPVLPVTAVLARDVEIAWSDDGELTAAMAQPQNLGHEVRFGCFRLTRAEVVGGRISMPDPQLIGYLSDLLPRSPDPDPRLPWPKHTGPGG
jgi:hypothetical protein